MFSVSVESPTSDGVSRPLLRVGRAGVVRPPSVEDERTDDATDEARGAALDTLVTDVKIPQRGAHVKY